MFPDIMYYELTPILVQKLHVDILIPTKRTEMVATGHIFLPQNIPKCHVFADRGRGKIRKKGDGWKREATVAKEVD